MAWHDKCVMSTSILVYFCLHIAGFTSAKSSRSQLLILPVTLNFRKKRKNLTISNSNNIIKIPMSMAIIKTLMALEKIKWFPKNPKDGI